VKYSDIDEISSIKIRLDRLNIMKNELSNSKALVEISDHKTIIESKYVSKMLLNVINDLENRLKELGVDL